VKKYMYWYSHENNRLECCAGKMEDNPYRNDSLVFISDNDKKKYVFSKDEYSDYEVVRSKLFMPERNDDLARKILLDDAIIPMSRLMEEIRKLQKQLNIIECGEIHFDTVQ